MTGFLQWMAGDYDHILPAFRSRVEELRAMALNEQAHARTPHMIASLQAAFDLFLEFSDECGAVDIGLRHDLSAQCWSALREAAGTQGKHQAASEPAARYISVLCSCLFSGQAHLAARNGSCPKQSTADCGWRCDISGKWQPQGRCVGWIDGADIYLEPTAAYEAVQIAGRNISEGLPISEQTLRKRLRERGMLASIDERRGTLTIRRTIGGSSKEVLHFRRGTLLPGAPDCSESNCEESA